MLVYDESSHTRINKHQSGGNVLLICEGILFVLGLIVIFTGRFKVSRGRTITGSRARLAGLFLALPGPLALLVGLFVGASLANDQVALRNALGTITILEFLFVIASVIIAVVIGITAPDSDLAIAGAVPGTSSTLPDILTVSEAATYFRVSEDTIRQMIASGQLRAVAIGDDYRISREALNAVFRS
jgi:excisionase family DNA binding protein